MSPITKDTVVVSLNAPTHFPIKLTTTNFAVWSRQVQAALIGLDLFSYIDGSLSPPARFLDDKNTQPNDLYSIWHRQDQILVAALLGSCSDQIQPTVASAASARDIWLRLSNAYVSTTPGRVLFLKAKLAHNPKGARSIVDYLKDMSDISDALALAGSPVSGADLVASIITQLGDEYRSVYSALRVRETLVSLAELSDTVQTLSLSLLNMAVQMWEALKESITAYTGLSPAAFFTAIAAALAVYHLLSPLFGSSDVDLGSSRKFEEEEAEEVKPLPPPVQIGDVTDEELKQYDGSDPAKPLLMAIKAQIYDVSQSRMFYGPGGPFALFAGKDASRALAKMSFDEKDVTGDLTGLGHFELEALQDWEYKCMSKYVKVGTVKSVVPVSEEAAVNGDASKVARRAIGNRGKGNCSRTREKYGGSFVT